MTIFAKVQNGVLTLPTDAPPLPEGAEVQIIVPEPDAFDRWLAKHAGTTNGLPEDAAPLSKSLPTPAEQTLGEAGEDDDLGWMREFIGCIDGLPEDFAAEHDHYIHGTPKRNNR